MVVTLSGIIRDGDKETFIKMPSGFGKHDGKDYYFDFNKAYKIGNYHSVCFFTAQNSHPIEPLPRNEGKIIITKVTNYRKKIKELFGRVDL